MQHLPTFIMCLSIKPKEEKYPMDRWKKSVCHIADKTLSINILQFFSAHVTLFQNISYINNTIHLSELEGFWLAWHIYLKMCKGFLNVLKPPLRSLQDWFQPLVHALSSVVFKMFCQQFVSQIMLYNLPQTPNS